MKKIYLKPEIEEVTISMQQLISASKKVFFGQKHGLEEDDEVDDFDLLL